MAVRAAVFRLVQLDKFAAKIAKNEKSHQDLRSKKIEAKVHFTVFHMI